MDEMRIHFLGDELVAGYGDPRALGWTGRVMARTPREIDAVWMQLGVEDPAAADRAREAGLLVVMDTCPKIEWRQLRNEGAAR